MQIVNLIYNSFVIIMSILIFFMKVTSPYLELPLKTIGKLVPLFCIAYATIQIFKMLGII